MTLEEVLFYHVKKYPAMCPTDAVKLLYQNEFGGGHMIEDPKRSLAWIEREYGEIQHDNRQSLTVPIGNGMVRYNLAAIDTKNMPLTRLNEIFVETSNTIHGNIASFEEKLEVLVDLTKKYSFSFTEVNIH